MVSLISTSLQMKSLSIKLMRGIEPWVERTTPKDEGVTSHEIAQKAQGGF